MKEGFTIICNKCESREVDTQYYDGKTVYECENCGQHVIEVVIDE